MYVYSPDISVNSSQCHIPRDNAAQFSAAVAICTIPIFVPPGTHYCRVDRGGVDSKLAQGFYTWPGLTVSNSRPLALGSNALTTRPRAPTCFDILFKITVTYKWMNKLCLRLWFCTCNAIAGRRQPGLMRWILLWIIPLVQDRSLDLLTSSQGRHHCITDALRMQGSQVYRRVFVLYTRYHYAEWCVESSLKNISVQDIITFDSFVTWHNWAH